MYTAFVQSKLQNFDQEGTPNEKNEHIKVNFQNMLYVVLQAIYYLFENSSTI